MLLVINLANKNDAKKWLKPWHMGTYLRALNESYLINTNMTGLRFVFSKKLCILVLGTKVASALEIMKQQLICTAV